MDKTIIAIIGASGTGKDTVAHMLSEITDYPLICSYTTRPMRDGEQNGREHWFVSKLNKPDKEDMLAYTVYGGYEYWTEYNQLSDTTIYVIDEKGVLDIMGRFPHINVIKVLVTAMRTTRIRRGISYERMKRDQEREMLMRSVYDHIIHNNGTLEHLKKKVNLVAHNLISVIEYERT